MTFEELRITVAELGQRVNDIEKRLGSIDAVLLHYACLIDPNSGLPESVQATLNRIKVRDFQKDGVLIIKEKDNHAF